MVNLNINKWNYGNYSSENYGSHCQAISIGCLTLWFSYNTVIAFKTNGHLPRVIQNYWSTTTGRHLNCIDGGNKKERLDAETFETELKEALKEHNIEV